MWAFFLPLVFLGFMLFQSDRSQIVPEEVTSARTTPQSVTADYLAGTHAALAFAEANQGYSGPISDSQLAPYVQPYALPAGFVAEIQNGQLVAWSSPQDPVLVKNVWNSTGDDCAYAVNTDGALQSPCGPTGAAPGGAPDGSMVYSVVAPHN
jgi:hypothetical protein